MVNQVFVDESKIKDILTYIQGVKHPEQTRTCPICLSPTGNPMGNPILCDTCTSEQEFRQSNHPHD